MTWSRVADAYDARADEYVDLFGSVDSLAATDRTTIEQWRDQTTGLLLDAGCGPGHWTDVLTHEGARTAIGLDGSARFLQSARRRFPHVGFLRGDLGRLPVPDGATGGILAWYSIIHTAPSQVPSLLAEFARVLRPGGSLLLGFVDGAPGTPFDHAVTTAYHWSAPALEQRLAPCGLTVQRASTRQDPGVRPHGELVATRAT